MKITELVKKGHSVQEIASTLDMTRAGIYKWIKTRNDQFPRVFEAALRHLRPDWFM